MEKVRLGKERRYSLSRTRDGAGDSGMMLRSLDPKTGNQAGEFGDIVVGHVIQCGTQFARTFGSDWWMTTPVTEIISVNEDKTEVVFKTGNSEYKARSF